MLNSVELVKGKEYLDVIWYRCNHFLGVFSLILTIKVIIFRIFLVNGVITNYLRQRINFAYMCVFHVISL